MTQLAPQVHNTLKGENEMESKDKAIVAACTDCWDKEFIKGLKNSKNCSGFVKAVAAKLGVALPQTGNADAIIDAIKDWTQLKSGIEALREAASGKFVLVGLKAAQHKPVATNGHIAIVVTGEVYHKIYPLVWCGSIGAAQSKGVKSVGEVWKSIDRDKVVYYAHATSPPKA